MILQFGKYRGCEIADVPIEYLEWLRKSNQTTLDAIEAEIARREDLEMQDASWAERIITAGYRQMSKQHHPDIGGDEDAMKQVNIAAEELRRMAKQKWNGGG